MDLTATAEDVRWESYPQFSIIVPVYNTVDYLVRCVDSILGQGCKDFELILVDDGSSDGSGELCDACCSKDSRVRCIHQKNAGVSSARNMGLANARGRYVWFCDSDDTVMEGALNSIALRIAETYPAMVSFAVEQVDDNGFKLGFIPAPKPSRSVDQGPLQCDDLLYPYAHVFRRDLADGESFDASLALLEDRDFFYRIAWKAAGDTEVIEEPLYRYLITRKESAVNSSGVKKYVDATRVQANIFKNEEALGHVMPAFKLFASHSIGVLSRVVRAGSLPAYYETVRGRLLKYRRYSCLLKGSLRIKYLLILHMPSVFCMTTRLLGAVRGARSAGSTVVVHGSRR